MHIIVAGDGRRGGAVQRRGVQAAEVPGRRSRRRRKPAKLNGDVKVTGKATAYTGAADRRGEGRATASPARSASPIWFYDCCWWRLPPHRGAAQEIAHGTAITEPDGTFTDHVRREAGPDRAGEGRADLPLHRHADVTDTTGETRTGTQSVQRRLHGAAGERSPPTTWQTAGKDVKVDAQHDDARRRGPGGEGHGEGLPAEAAGDRCSGRTSLGRHRRRAVAARARSTPSRSPTRPTRRRWELGDVVASADFATDDSTARPS